MLLGYFLGQLLVSFSDSFSAWFFASFSALWYLAHAKAKKQADEKVASRETSPGLADNREAGREDNRDADRDASREAGRDVGREVGLDFFWVHKYLNSWVLVLQDQLKNYGVSGACAFMVIKGFKWLLHVAWAVNALSWSFHFMTASGTFQPQRPASFHSNAQLIILWPLSMALVRSIELMLKR